MFPFIANLAERKITQRVCFFGPMLDRTLCGACGGVGATLNGP